METARTHNQNEILPKLDVRQCQSEMLSKLLDMRLMLMFHQSYPEPAPMLQCPVCKCWLSSHLMQQHILHQHPPIPNPKLQVDCHYCHTKFSHCDLPRHLDSRHGPNAWTECVHCKKLLRNTQMDLESHLFQDHAGGQLLVCLTCDILYSLTGQEQAHMHTHLNFKCPLHSCSQTFDSFASLREHVLISHTQFEQEMQAEFKKETFDILRSISVGTPDANKTLKYGGPVTCDICNKTVKHKYSLIQHKNKVHNLNLTFDCEKCRIRYQSFKKLTRHLRYKHKGRDQVKEDSDTKLWKHVPHNASAPVLCGICNAYAKNKMILVKHINSKHLDVIGEPLPFCCDLCDKEFSNYLRLTHHTYRTHAPKLQCKHCGRLVNRNWMEKHLKTHEKDRKVHYLSEPKTELPMPELPPVLCNLCNFSAANMYALVKHINSVHLDVVNGPLPYCCDVCNKTFANYNNVMEHWKLVHLPKGGGMIRQQNMSSHFTEVHGRSRRRKPTLSPIRCIVCGYYATHKFSLLKHFNIEHLDLLKGQPLPFGCEVCHKVFGNYHNLMSHWRYMHVPKNKCQLCGKMISRHKLSEHACIHHSETANIGKESINGVEEMLIPEIEIVQEHPLNLVIRKLDEEQMDCLTVLQSADMKPPLDKKLPECQNVSSTNKSLECEACCFCTNDVSEFTTHILVTKHTMMKNQPY